MRWATKLRLRLRSLLRRDLVERELDEEMRFHLDRLTDEHVAAGLPPTDARQAALREMGGLDQRKEECRDARGLALFEELRQDVRYALRGLRKSPGFTTVAILSLALGIGANTTIFTFVNAVLLRPLPYPGSDRLVVLREQPLGAAGTVGVHPQNFLEWRARAGSFEALALVQAPPLNVIGANGAEQIARVQTTSELFRVFGVGPTRGRVFTPEETGPGDHDVVILSHGFWQRWFGGDPAVVGRRLAVREGSLTIVGVAPPGLRIGLIEPDVYTPLPIDPAKPDSIGSRSFQCYGRLKPGVGLDAARAEMGVVASALARQYPMDEGYGVFVSGLHEYLVREGRPALRLLMVVVAAVLIIACVNLAGLLMARGIRRRSELAVRASLGASRSRLVRQLVLESLVLSSLGGAAGLVLAYWGTLALVMLTAGALTVGSIEPIRLEPTCLVFTLVISTVTALVFGLLPAWQASRVEPQMALRERTRGGTADRRQHRMRSALVVTEVAMAVVLLVGAGLLLRTFSRLVRVDLGFQPAETITMGLFLGGRPDEARVALVDQILERVEALPGVKAASTIQFLPLTGMNCGTGFWLEGQARGDVSHASTTECSLVSRGYFAAMGIPIVDGRPFDRRDRMGGPRVVIVNQSFARQYFPGGRALGRRILVAWSDEVLAEIVGVVGDVRHNGLTSEPAPTVFLLHAQTPGYITNLVVRATGDASAQAAAVRSAIRDVDPTQAVSAGKTMEQYVADSLTRPRMYAALVACFAVLAVVLAAVGVYGLIAYVVAQRTHEIGIRLALGASRGDVFRAVFAQGARLAFTGLVLGVVAARGLRGLVSKLLFGVTAGDPVSYVTAAAVFAAVALAVAAIPAHRASRVDPTTALRCE
ncbi:MAG TPA: ABC transporter permease [Vicinamibacteria bacterium]